MGNKKIYKIVNKKYLTSFDGKGIITVIENGMFEYGELVSIQNRTYLRIYNGGVNIYSVSKKLIRRFRSFVNRGYSLIISVDYININKKKFKKKYI